MAGKGTHLWLALISHYCLLLFNLHLYLASLLHVLHCCGRRKWNGFLEEKKKKLFLKALILLSLYSSRQQSRRHLCSFLLRPCNCKCVKLCNVALQFVVVCLLVVKSGVLSIRILLNNIIRNSWRTPTPLLYQMLYSARNIAWILNTTLNMANRKSSGYRMFPEKEKLWSTQWHHEATKEAFLEKSASFEKKQKKTTCNVLFIIICLVFFPWAACCC